MREMILIVMIALITFLCRVLPFLIFSGKNQLPGMIASLEKQLPMTIMVLLVLYCIRNINFVSVSGWIPLCAASLVTVLVHIKKNNVLLSILAGTLLYMILIRWF